MDKEVKLAVIALVAMLAVFVVWQPLITVNNNGFSELAVLGPNQNLGSYPRQLVVGQPFLLYGYLENHMGTPEFYQFIVKLGNQSTLVGNTTTANAPVIFTLSRLLEDGQNYTFPMILSISNIGLNQRLIFELWTYDISKSNFTYGGIWNEIWVNVTSP